MKCERIGMWQSHRGGAGLSEVRVLVYVAGTVPAFVPVCLCAHMVSTAVCGEHGTGLM